MKSSGSSPALLPISRRAVEKGVSRSDAKGRVIGLGDPPNSIPPLTKRKCGSFFATAPKKNEPWVARLDRSSGRRQRVDRSHSGPKGIGRHHDESEALTSGKEPSRNGDGCPISTRFRSQRRDRRTPAQVGGDTLLRCDPRRARTVDRPRSSFVRASIMPKMIRKENLPTKTCAACGRPFAWRKKWKTVWDEVKTCSERCKGDLRRRGRSPA